MKQDRVCLRLRRQSFCVRVGVTVKKTLKYVGKKIKIRYTVRVCLPSSLHHNFSGDGNTEYAAVAVQAGFLNKDTKNYFLVMLYSTLFNIL